MESAKHFNQSVTEFKIYRGVQQRTATLNFNCGCASYGHLIGMCTCAVRTGRGRRVPCDVCSANSTVDDESLHDVVARTLDHLGRLLPKFTEPVSKWRRWFCRV